MAVRNYINGAPLLTLAVGINDTAVSLQVASTAGFPTPPFTLALERATANEEVVLCTALDATHFTVTRHWDGTTAVAHGIGTAVEHTTAAIDYVEANAHVNDSSTDVHAQYILKSVYNAKGRILVGTGAGTFTALAVGTDNYVAMADAAQASGVKWGQIVAASITDGTITTAKLDTSTVQSMIARQAGQPGAVNGRIYYETSNGRWYGYLNGWRLIPFGAGYITISSGAPSGGLDGDLWFRYT